MTDMVVDNLPRQARSLPLARGYWYDAEVQLTKQPEPEGMHLRNMIYPPKPQEVNRSSFTLICNELSSDAPQISSARLVPANSSIKEPMIIIHGLMLACEISVYCDDRSTPSGHSVINGNRSSALVKLNRIRKTFTEGDLIKLHLLLAA